MIAPGTRLGPYAITAPIGAGGMGEVYKATDTRLDRTVAIKVLPEHVASDPDLKQRFEREAKTLAALSHPHICPVFDVGSQAGIGFLVIEYLEGETLEQGLKKGALPLDQALQIGIQIADALAAAHRAGIVHRDLKPGNIMVTKSGAKLLDFGLAKTGALAVAGNLSILPTTPRNLTAQGTILGTFQYMAPEQLEGHEATARTDIFAFGAVVYEMVTGKKAFEGKSQASLIAAILERQPPPISQAQPLAPPLLDRVVKKCLAKDPEARWHAARDLLDELRWITEAGERPVTAGHSDATSTAPAVGVPQRTMWRRVALFSATTLVLTAGLATSLTWLLTPASSPRVSRLTLTTQGTAALSIDGVVNDLTITPDGTRVIYVGANGTALFVRALDGLEPAAIAKGAPRNPFVSPDGQWVGFFDGNSALKKVAITGGPAITVTGGLDSVPRGASWLPDDTIVFATGTVATGLQRVAAGGGTPIVVTRADPAQGELDHVWPEALPGGRAVLFTVTARTGGLEAAQVAALDLQTGTPTVVVRGGSHARYASSGHLVYGAVGTLRAVAFDLVRLETRGTPVPAVSDVATTGAGAVDAVVAGDGTLAYVSGGSAGVQRTLVWVDRQGRETPIPVPPRALLYPRITPDGRRVALFSGDQESDLWLWDVERTTLTRMTFDPGIDVYPAWTPDGRRLIFSSDRSGSRNLFWQAADGTGTVERLSESVNTQDPSAVSPDGTRLIFQETTATGAGTDLMQLDLDDVRASRGSAGGQPVGARRVTPLVQTPFTERNGIVSPDGRWLAYEANNSGQFEIYVRPYPEVSSGVWQVSTGGGNRPLWARNSQELFYLSPTGALMRVGVDRGPTWAAGAPAKLLNEGYFTVPGGNVGRTYDISPDGQRFLMIKVGGGSDQTAAPQIVIVQNWFDELKRLVPTN